MSCPDWQDLVRQRDEQQDDGPEWHAALGHLDDCPACQKAAPAAEPTLLFRRLPAPEAGRHEIEAMKQAVAGMRRGQTLEHGGVHRARRLPVSWARAAALAAVLLGSLLLRGAGTVSDESAPLAGLPAAAVLDTAAVANDVDLRQLPLIETADPTYGSIIQVVDDDISLVLVVPGEIDV